MAAMRSEIVTYNRPSGVEASRSSTTRITSFSSSSKGLAIIICRPAPMSMAQYTRLMSGRSSGGTAFETLDRPTETIGGGSQATWSVRTASISSGQYSWQPDTVRTRGSMMRSDTGKSISTIRGMSFSIAMFTRSSADTGIPLLPIVRAINLALYCLARRGTSSSRSSSAEVELMIGCALVIACSPASIPRRLVLSRHKGTSTTASTVCTIQGKTSSQSFLRGPRLRSSAWAPASTWAAARFWKNEASRSVEGALHLLRDDVDVLADDVHGRVLLGDRRLPRKGTALGRCAAGTAPK